MDNSTKIIITTSKDWQQQCQVAAEQKTLFEVHGIQSKDFEFCRSVCAQFNYGYKYKMAGKQFVVVFQPQEHV